jgi:hypothetical protein
MFDIRLELQARSVIQLDIGGPAQRVDPEPGVQRVVLRVLALSGCLGRRLVDEAPGIDQLAEVGGRPLRGADRLGRCPELAGLGAQLLGGQPLRLGVGCLEDG